MPRSILSPARIGLAACPILVFCTQAAAQQDPPGLPLWEIGGAAFGLSQPAYPGAGQHVDRALVLPFVLYRGKYLRADRDTAGLRAVKTERFELDVGFSGSLGSSSDDIDARRGMPDLGTLVEFGPRMQWQLGAAPFGGRWRAEVPLRGVFDLSDGMAHRGWALEPKLAYERRSAGGWGWGMSVGALIGDRRLARTLYGVAPTYARADRPAYEASSGLIAWRLQATLSSPASRDWRVFSFARLDSVSGAANRDSPLVRRDSGASIGVGVAYTWLRSERRAVD